MQSLLTIKPRLDSRYLHISCGWEGQGDLIRVHKMGCPGCNTAWSDDETEWKETEVLYEEDFLNADWD